MSQTPSQSESASENSSASADPGTHRAREQAIISHVQSLLRDSRLTLDTTLGRRSITTFEVSRNANNRGVDVKRLMSEMGRPDRDLMDRMPLGETLDVTLSKRRWLLLKRVVGRLRVVCVSPTAALLADQSGKPMSGSDVAKVLRSLPPAIAGEPVTTLLVSTSGFTIDARDQVDRTPKATILLGEPNNAGGWSVHGPPETQALADLLDPESAEEKRSRVRTMVAQKEFELSGGGVAADKLSAQTQLPLQVVEAELKSYAKENPGLAAKRLDGRIVLYREGTTPVAAPLKMPGKGAKSAGDEMPLIDRIKSLFNRRGETEKKIAFLSERRAALSQQRDRGYEEIGTLEAKDGELREQFKAARAPLTKRRITSQLVQLRKDIERRQQMLSVLNQQVNVVSTHLHNLELTQQGKAAELPDTEEIANDAAAAEEMLAKLQADNELADSVGLAGGGSSVMSGMSEEEQALYAELEADGAPGEPGASDAAPARSAPTASSSSGPTPPIATPNAPRRAEPEPG